MSRDPIAEATSMLRKKGKPSQCSVDSFDSFAACPDRYDQHDPRTAKLLRNHPKKIVVKFVHLRDFQPSRTKVEKADIETVVGEFPKFLEAALDAECAGQSTIMEIR